MQQPPCYRSRFPPSALLVFRACGDGRKECQDGSARFPRLLSFFPTGLFCGRGFHPAAVLALQDRYRTKIVSKFVPHFSCSFLLGGLQLLGGFSLPVTWLALVYNPCWPPPLQGDEGESTK
jgi:hypothetical protein